MRIFIVRRSSRREPERAALAPALSLVEEAAEPREFTLVNISGKIDLKDVAGLRRTFLPHEPDKRQVALSLAKPGTQAPLEPDAGDLTTNGPSVASD